MFSHKHAAALVPRTWKRELWMRENIFEPRGAPEVLIFTCRSEAQISFPSAANQTSNNSCSNWCEIDKATWAAKTIRSHRLFIYFFHVFGVNSKMLFRRNKANSKGEKLIMKGCVYIGRKPNGWRVSEDNYNIFSCRTIEMLNDSSANDIAQRLAFEKTSFVNRNLSLSRPFRHDLHKFTQQILHRDNEKANADV